MEDYVLSGLQKISEDVSSKKKDILKKSILPTAMLAAGILGGVYGPRVLKNIKSSRLFNPKGKWTEKQMQNFASKFNDFLERKGLFT